MDGERMHEQMNYGPRFPCEIIHSSSVRPPFPESGSVPGADTELGGRDRPRKDEHSLVWSGRGRARPLRRTSGARGRPPRSPPTAEEREASLRLRRSSPSVRSSEDAEQAPDGRPQSRGV